MSKVTYRTYNWKQYHHALNNRGFQYSGAAMALMLVAAHTVRLVAFILTVASSQTKHINMIEHINMITPDKTHCATGYSE